MISDTPSAGWTSLDLNTRLRPCEPGDVPQITAIYAHAVRHGRASFELEPPDKTEMERRHHLLLQRYVEGLTPDGTADGQLFFIDVPDASTFKTKPLNFGVERCLPRWGRQAAVRIEGRDQLVVGEHNIGR